MSNVFRFDCTVSLFLHFASNLNHSNCFPFGSWCFCGVFDFIYNIYVFVRWILVLWIWTASESQFLSTKCCKECLESWAGCNAELWLTELECPRLPAKKHRILRYGRCQTTDVKQVFSRSTFCPQTRTRKDLKMLRMSTQRVPPDSELWWDLSDKSSTRMYLPGTTPSSHSQVRVWVNRSHCQGSFSEILVTKTRPLTFLTQSLMDVSTRVKLAHRFARQVTVLWVVIGCKVSLHRPTRRAFQNKLKCPFLNAFSTFSTCLNCLFSYRRVLHVFPVSPSS